MKKSGKINQLSVPGAGVNLAVTGLISGRIKLFFAVF